MKIMSNQKKLTEAIIKEDFFETSEILEEMYNNAVGEEYVEVLINFMSDNPDIDYGMTGPIVHLKACLQQYSSITGIANSIGLGHTEHSSNTKIIPLPFGENLASHFQHELAANV